MPTSDLHPHLDELWRLHRVLKPRTYPHRLRTQVVRARGVVDMAIAEITDLHRALRQPGLLDLDQEISDTDEEARHA